MHTNHLHYPFFRHHMSPSHSSSYDTEDVNHYEAKPYDHYDDDDDDYEDSFDDIEPNYDFFR